MLVRSHRAATRVGINATSVQNPLTTLEESVAATQRALAPQDGPTVLVGHSFSGMIVTEAGVDPKVTALVYVAARAPDAGEDYTALAKRYPTPPASAGIVWSGDYGQLSEAAFLRDFAGDLSAAQSARALRGTSSVQSALLAARQRKRRGGRSRAGTPCPPRTGRSIRICNGSWRSGWAPPRSSEGSHLSLISQPDAITRLILQAAGRE